MITGSLKPRIGLLTASLLISIALIGTLSTPFACAMDDKMGQASQAEFWTTYSTPELLEILSLLKEQGFRIGMMDILLNNVSDQTFTPALQAAVYKVRRAANQLLEEAKKGYVNFGPVSEARKRLALNILYSFYSLPRHFKSLDIEERLIALLQKYKSCDIFAPLRELTFLIHEYIDTDTGEFSSADNFVPKYEQLEPKIKEFIQQHLAICQGLKKFSVDIIFELMKRLSHEQMKTAVDIFSGEPFLVEVMQGNSQLPAPHESTPVDHSADAHGRQPLTIESVQNWPTANLQEFASLMDEQTYWVNFLNSIINDIPDHDLDEQIKCNRIRVKNVAIRLMKDRNMNIEASENPVQRGFNLFVAFTHCAVEHAAELYEKKHLYKYIIEALGNYSNAELLHPLHELISLIFSRINQNLITGGEVIMRYDELRVRINALIQQHNSMSKKLEQTFCAVVKQLFSRTAADTGKEIRNIFSGNPFAPIKLKADARVDGIQSVQVSAPGTPVSRAKAEKKKAAKARRRASKAHVTPPVEDGAPTAHVTPPIEDIYALQEYLFPGSFENRCLNVHSTRS